MGSNDTVEERCAALQAGKGLDITPKSDLSKRTEKEGRCVVEARTKHSKLDATTASYPCRLRAE